MHSNCSSLYTLPIHSPMETIRRIEYVRTFLKIRTQYTYTLLHVKGYFFSRINNGHPSFGRTVWCIGGNTWQHIFPLNKFSGNLISQDLLNFWISNRVHRKKKRWSSRMPLDATILQRLMPNVYRLSLHMTSEKQARLFHSSNVRMTCRVVGSISRPCGVSIVLGGPLDDLFPNLTRGYVQKMVLSLRSFLLPFSPFFPLVDLPVPYSI